jgi:hypothetical protein
MLRQMIVMSALLLMAGCDYSYDAEGKQFPPDVSCASVAGCMTDSSKLGDCVGGCTDGDQDCAWACLPCLDTETTQEEFMGFYKGCIGDELVTLLAEASKRQTLIGCLSNDDQILLIDICATRD